ncbi:NB-ARC domain-containing protein [Nonomuraea sp. B19D2]|uniref:NB-ARC domain-containing protein n=1 Tax=Nonomuraea sp. B19D2 TaxID=3159561 RepID=UPI0032DA254B
MVEVKIEVSMARKRTLLAHVTASLLVLLGIICGLATNVVSEYFPEIVTERREWWVGGLVGTGLLMILLTVLAPILANRRAHAHLFHVPPLEEGWVTRAELDKAINTLLRRDTGAVGVTTALVGAGGFGKTSLAIAACRDDRVRRHFKGGIAWVSIGQERTGSDLTSLINDLVEELDGTRPETVDAEVAGRMLANSLAERGRVLLVVDDIWSTRQLRPFLPITEQSRLLVTTRRPRTLPDASANVLVDEMTPHVAIQLLTRNLEPMGEELTTTLLQLTGRWPLLLSLVNARLVIDANQGADLIAAGSYAAKRLLVAGPAALDVTETEQRETAVAATVEYSSSALGQGGRDRFLELGIFPEDIEIPLPVIELFWHSTGGLSAEQTRRLCEELEGLSLISKHWLDGSTPAVVLHDVIRAYALSDHGLGADGAVAAHRAFVEGARELLGNDRASGEWWQLPSSASYLWNHLAYHMRGATMESELDALVGDARWLVERICRFGLVAAEGDLNTSTSPLPQQIARYIARNTHLLDALDSEPQTRSHILSHLYAIPGMMPSPAVACRTMKTSFIQPSWPMLEECSSELLRTLIGHTKSVRTVAISADGTWLASSSTDGTIRVWGTDGTLQAVITQQKAEVESVAVAPRGKWLAASLSDGTVSVWNADGTLRSTVDGSGGTKTVAIAPDGSWFTTSTSQEDTVCLWDVDGNSLGTLIGHTGGVNHVAIAPNGTWIATASYDGTVRSWEPNGRLLHIMEGHSDGVKAVSISADGSYIVSTSYDGTVRQWTCEGADRNGFPIRAPRTKSTAIAPAGAWLATLSNEDLNVRIWNSDGTMRAALPMRSINAMVLAPEGSVLVTLSDDNLIRTWDKNGRGHAILRGHTGRITAAAIASDGTWLASASNDSTVRLWTTEANDEDTRLAGVKQIAVSQDSTWLATVSDDRAVRLWNANGNERTTLPEAADHVLTAPNGAWLVTISNETYPDRSTFIGRRHASAARTKVSLWSPNGTKSALAAGPDITSAVVEIAPDSTWLAAVVTSETYDDGKKLGKDMSDSKQSAIHLWNAERHTTNNASSRLKQS